MVDKATAKILALDFARGKEHDFKLFKRSNLRLSKETKLLADTGYLGIIKLIDTAKIPHKCSKNHPLTKVQKAENKKISSQRILCENVIGSVKRFRILSERYRNRRKRFGLRFNLIAGIYNYELG